MDFAELIITPKLDGVILHSPFSEPIDGTLCITGHHMILSSRKEDVQELWVILHEPLYLIIKYWLLSPFSAFTSVCGCCGEETNCGKQ